jgi:hypothetical protein
LVRNSISGGTPARFRPERRDLRHGRHVPPHASHRDRYREHGDRHVLPGGLPKREPLQLPQRVHGELLIKRRWVCGTGRARVPARRTAADRQRGTNDDHGVRTGLFQQARCGRAIHCNKRRIGELTEPFRGLLSDLLSRNAWP